MKILFVCGSFAAGRDGVGDYTRRLACELIALGHSCAVIAINDAGPRVIVTTGRGGAEEGIPALRLFNDTPWESRELTAQNYIRDFAPDIISLQFVPYSFHPRGLIYRWIDRLARLFHGWTVHIMFHELWVMWWMRCGLRDRVVGVAQKMFVLSFLRRLRPRLGHTTIAVYQAALKDHGVTVDLLPLLGGIRRNKAPEGTANVAELPLASSDEASARSETWTFGFFGNISKGWDPEALLAALTNLRVATRKEVNVLSIGNCGVFGEQFFDRMRTENLPGFTFLRLGPQSEERVSEYLRRLDFGLTTYSEMFLGKSSAVAAMREHGLPVVVSEFRDTSYHKVGGGCDPMIIRADEDFVQRVITFDRRSTHGGSQDVTGRLAETFQRLTAPLNDSGGILNVG
ncbi:hypothetical protein ACXR0O_14770 [Verrucomicrobiota bacterium sgz303538]